MLIFVLQVILKNKTSTKLELLSQMQQLFFFFCTTIVIVSNEVISKQIFFRFLKIDLSCWLSVDLGMKWLQPVFCFQRESIKYGLHNNCYLKTQLLYLKPVTSCKYVYVKVYSHEQWSSLIRLTVDALFLKVNNESHRLVINRRFIFDR